MKINWEQPTVEETIEREIRKEKDMENDNIYKDFIIFFRNREPLTICAYRCECSAATSTSEGKVISWIKTAEFFDIDDNLVASFASEDIYGVSIVRTLGMEVNGISQVDIQRQLALPAPAHKMED